MLNGKFFTGLPPKMIDRGGAGGRNRLESHFFWPDDTKVETAVESRIKRRNSVQLANTEKPLHEKQAPVGDNEVDTKKRFNKEFSQSSIQFYDNFNDSRVNSRRPLLRNSVGSKKTEIAEKPTNTKLELPESVVDEAYTTAKKKQAYTSKIEFYDYVSEGEKHQNNRNNLRKPRMDMNDKREMELNTKNSPKLQVKRDVRSLSEEKDKRKINNIEVRAMEKNAEMKINDGSKMDQRERDRILINEERYSQNKKSAGQRINSSPKRGLTKPVNNYERRYSTEREMYREPDEPFTRERQKSSYYEHSEDVDDFGRDTATPELYENHKFFQKDYRKIHNISPNRGKREEPKRNIRNRQYYVPSESKDYTHGCQSDEEIRSRMRDVHLKLPSQRKQFYSAEEYYDDEPNQNYYSQYDNIQTPTYPGSSHKHNERELIKIDSPHENNKATRRLNLKKSPINKINNPIQQKIVPTPSSPPPSDAESFGSTKNQKHLRSSLCFNDGEIVGINDVARSPTSGTQYPTQRRNARSSATQRVSVGLPD